MNPQVPPPSPGLTDIGPRAVALARRWTDKSQSYPVARAALLLSRVLKDPAGLQYTVDFVDGVVRPEDLHVAARNLAKLGRQNPKFLPPYLALPARIGGLVAPLVPSIAVPMARRVFAMLVGDLVLDVSPSKLGKAIERVRGKDGARLNMNLLGEAVLGEAEASRRLTETMRLLERDDVDYVSMKVSAVTGPHNPWGFEEVVEHAVEQLLPLYRKAASYPKKKFINLDMEEYRDLWITIEVFKRLLEREELHSLEAGIVLQSYLPDSLEAMIHLQEWAAKRVDAGGARIKVRVVKGANLAMERVDAQIHGWEQTTQPSKQASDANYMRILDYALHPERIKNLWVGVAGHNLFTLAFAWELAGERGVRDGVELEMLAGMATAEAAAVTEDVGRLLLYVPVVRPEEYDVAIAYLVRRLEENSAPENFMSAIFDLDDDAMFNRERDRFLAALDDVKNVYVGSNRKQNRLTETAADVNAPVVDAKGSWSFGNTPDSDPALPANLEWARGIASRIPTSKLGIKAADDSVISDAQELDAMIRATAKAGKEWGKVPAAQRAELLHKVGEALALRRGELIEVAGSEAGKTIDQADVEVSEAIDFAHYYATYALELDKISGTEFQPRPLTLITPPWNFPLAIPAGGVLAALAAGSAVLLKPAKVSRRCGALLAEIMWDAGVPKEILQLVQVSERELGKQLITHDEVDQVILTGAGETAELFRSWKPALNLFAETSGKNSIIVTPSADLDLAVKDVVQSAFGHAGQKCSAGSLAILVGSVAHSKRFHGQLMDAVKSLVVGQPQSLRTQMGPVVELPGEKLKRGLTTLGPGERWNIRPQLIDQSGKQWTPGVRSGVVPGSEYHLTEYFGPILGVIAVDTLDEAIEVQNAVEFGLTAGIHSLDADEIKFWLDNVQAGNAYINRGITGAIVRRQPFGGWKRSAVGNGTKAGGPSYLMALGDWAPDGNAPTGSSITKTVLRELAEVGAKVLSKEDSAWLNCALASDEACANEEFDVHHDPSGLRGVERNILRYVPAGATIRLSEGEKLRDLLRIVGASLAVGHAELVELTDGSHLAVRRITQNDCEEIVFVNVSSGVELPAEVVDFFERWDIEFDNASDEQFYALSGHRSWGLDGRIRLIGGDREALGRGLSGSIDVAVWAHPVTPAGRLEIMPFVREQAIAMTDHRFGNPTPLGKQVFGDN